LLILVKKLMKRKPIFTAYLIDILIDCSSMVKKMCTEHFRAIDQTKVALGINHLFTECGGKGGKTLVNAFKQKKKTQ